MKYFYLLILTGLLSCKNELQINQNHKAKKDIIYVGKSNELIDTTDVEARIIGYWSFDSIYVNDHFEEGRDEYKSIGFSFQRDNQIVEFQQLEKGKSMTVLGNYKVSGDEIFSTEFSGVKKVYKIHELTDTTMVLIQEYNGNSFVYVCLKDRKEAILDEKIYGKRKK